MPLDLYHKDGHENYASAQAIDTATGKDAPVSVCTTIAFLSFRSSAHVVSILSANHARFVSHVASGVSVLHVPHIMVLSAVTFCWACLRRGRARHQTGSGGGG